MPIDRRRLLLAGAALATGCRSGPPPDTPDPAPLDDLFAAYRDTWPEADGSGANHYPMAAEVLETLGAGSSIPGSWRTGVDGYRRAPARPGAAVDYRRHRAGFAAAIARDGWRRVLRDAVPQLVDGFVTAGCHGVIRTGHAARALQRSASAARGDELAAALAYWATDHQQLPAHGSPVAVDELLPRMQECAKRAPRALDDVPFAEVTARLVVARGIPGRGGGGYADPAAALLATARTAALAYAAQFALGRQRIWLLHAVTAPAAAALLVPFVDAATADRLVAAAQQAVCAWLAAFGAPFAVPQGSAPTTPWRELRSAAVASRSVHTLKLVEALHRAEDGQSPHLRGVAHAWLAWR